MLRMRRCLGLGVLMLLTAVLSLGALHAQTADQKGDAQKAVVKDQAKVAQPPLKTYAFQYTNAPWAEVLEFLSKITDLPFIGAIRPTGSFTFISTLKGTDGKAKQYTVPEIIDIINESLLPQKFMIVRRMASITILAADEPIDPIIIRAITVDQLPGYGKTEMVKITYPLKNMSPRSWPLRSRKSSAPSARSFRWRRSTA